MLKIKGCLLITSFIFFFIIFILGAVAIPVYSQQQPSDEEAAVEATDPVQIGVQPPEDDFNRGTPRGTLSSFFKTIRAGNFIDATHYLDLKALPSDIDISGERLARQLKVILDRTLLYDPRTMSSHPEGNLDDSLQPDLEFVGRIEAEYRYYDILLQRVSREDGEYVWVFSSSTVSEIPEMYNEFGYGPLGEYLSTLFGHVSFLDIQLWQWVGLVGSLVIAYFISLLLTKLILLIVRLKKGDVRKPFVRFMNNPARILLMILIAKLMEGVLDLAIAVRTVFGAQTFLIFAVVWLVIRLIDLVFDRINVRLQQHEQTTANTMFRTMANMIKFVIILFGLVIWLDNIGVKVTTLVAGIGIGGAAIALAAQDPLRNLFASLTILLDKPFLLGDRIIVSGFDGVVESIGLRSTTLRLLTGHQSSIPNQEITRLGIENIGRRPHIRRLNNIRLAYDTPPKKIERAIEIIKGILENHEGLHPDFPPRVYFNDLNDDSLNILMIYWYHPANYWDYTAFNNRVNLAIVHSFGQEGITLAPPTMTALLKQTAPGISNSVDNQQSSPDKNDISKREKNIVGRCFNMVFTYTSPIWAEWPGADARRLSMVRSGTDSTSARAIYAASYAVIFCRSSHIRGRNISWG